MVLMGLPDAQGATLKRALWVPKEVDDAFTGQAGFIDFADPRFAGLLQRYIAGTYVSGTLHGDPKKYRPDFERLLNIDEVWVMCFRSPKINQWRLMGRFTQKDEFISLGFYQRGYLDGEKKYHSVAQTFLTRWQSLCGGASFLRGSKIQDYISMPVSDPYVPII